MNLDLEDLGLADGLLARAGLAAVLVGNDGPLALAVVADALALLDHAGGNLADGDLDAAALAAAAGGAGARLAAGAGAAGADDAFGELKLGDLALVEVLEGDAEWVERVLALPRAPPAAPHGPPKEAAEEAAAHAAAHAAHAAAEDVAEQVLGAPEAGVAARLLDAVEAAAVVELPLFLVGEDLVGEADLLELQWKRSVCEFPSRRR